MAKKDDKVFFQFVLDKKTKDILRKVAFKEDVSQAEVVRTVLEKTPEREMIQLIRDAKEKK